MLEVQEKTSRLLKKYLALLTFMWVKLASICPMMLNNSLFSQIACSLSCLPEEREPKEGHPAKILNGMLNRPRYISETRPSGSDSPKCLTLGLNRLPKFSHGGGFNAFALPRPPASHEQVRAQACAGKQGQSNHHARQTRPSLNSKRGEGLRKADRMVNSVLTMHALRGPVNWGADKKRRS